MEDAPSPMTPKEEIKESFEIKQEEKNYKLNIEIINQEIILNVFEKNLMKEYEIKLSFDELKALHKIFLTLNSSQDFIDFIKAAIENKKILIKENKDNQITIELMIEHLFKQNIIKFDLIKKKMNLELIVQDLYQKIEKVTKENKIIKDENTKMKEDINNLKKDNNKIKDENKIMKQENENLIDENFEIKEKIKYIENENKNLINKINNLEIKISCLKNNLFTLNKNKDSISFDSAIMEKNEFEMINSAIKQKMNKEIKEIKKIYQSTKDGGEPTQFHKLCNNIPNTLVLYKSAGDRRFGGFAYQCWDSENHTIEDKNCFLFSLDKKKVYFPKNNNFKIDNYSDFGPCFCNAEGFSIIRIGGNAPAYKNLKTNEEDHKDIFDGDKNALSEDGKHKGVYAKEYEVFQIIFK